jgi:hypothetical protein
VIRRRIDRRAGVAVLLLAVATLLTGARLSDATSTGGVHHFTFHVSPPSGLPPLARWVDVNHGTAYTVALQASQTFAKQVGARLTFTTPSGDQLVAALPITKLADGTYSQSTPINATQTPTCVQGVLLLSNNSGGEQSIVYTLLTHFDQYALVAYAHLVYAPASDKLGAAGVCGGQTGLGKEQALDMLAGCDASSCSSPVDTAGPMVTGFESSVAQAAKQGTPQSWLPIYSGTSRVITGQYDDAGFAKVLSQQAQQKGHITSITPTTQAPQVQFSASGQAYFTVTDKVTLTKNGNTSTVTVTSYYLLQSGQWVFWFSMPIGS